MTAQRGFEGFQPDWDLDLAYGRQGELIVQNLAEWMLDQKVEVKRDRLYPRTGNFFVEFECKTRGGWAPSGLSTSSSLAWAFVLGDSGITISMPTEILKELVADRTLVLGGMRGSHPTRGALLPASHIVAYSRGRL